MTFFKKKVVESGKIGKKSGKSINFKNKLQLTLGK